jgi:O-methyltransferase
MALISDADLSALLEKISALPGDYAEVGVYRGATFRRLARDAERRKIIAHAFDSFLGMDEPTAMDGPNYPKGRLSCGGVGNFARMMGETGISQKFYQLHAGYIPDCFREIPATLRFKFALIDVDQYAPTLAALEWIWPRMTVGGIVVCDDYFPGAQKYASAGVDEFLRQSPGPYERKVIGLFNTQLVLEV